MIRYLLYLVVGGVLFLIGLAALTPMIMARASPLLIGSIAGFLVLAWLGLGFFFGVWSDLLTLLGGGRKRPEEERERARRRLEAPDWRAAEALHGKLPADVAALYRSDLRLRRDVEIGEGERSVLVGELIAIDAPYSNAFYPELDDQAWIPILEDGFGNVYAARRDESVDGRTPLYLFDHETGDRTDRGAAEPTDLTVSDLLTLPIQPERARA